MSPQEVKRREVNNVYQREGLVLHEDGREIRGEFERKAEDKKNEGGEKGFAGELGDDDEVEREKKDGQAVGWVEVISRTDDDDDSIGSPTWWNIINT